VEPDGVRAEVPAGGPAGDELGRKTGEKALEGPGTAGQQAVGVTGLRDAAAVAGDAADGVALDDGHGGEAVGQHARREQAGDAAAEDDRVAALGGGVGGHAGGS
jgi:hypothetical protein